jgi:TPR repeat protein
MLALADMSAGGEGLAVPDAQEAAAWLSRAAQLGNSQAAFLWGYMLEHGQGGWPLVAASCRRPHHSAG